MSLRLLSTIGILSASAVPVTAFAAPSFSDIPAGNPHYGAVEYLKDLQILQGYEDGTFRLEQTVNRAEMVKIIIGSVGGSGSSAVPVAPWFRDVPSASWFAPYVADAVKAGLIDQPSTQSSFRPQDPVTKAETLKMLFTAYGIDALTSYGEISYPLATDTSSASDWFYPYLRYGLTASVVQADEGLLQPGNVMTRGQTADLLYRFLLYREGKQTQTLLSMTENEVLNALQLTDSAPEAARQAAARAILSARGALASRPDDAVAKAGVKTAEGAMALAEAAAAAAVGDSSKAVDRASTAWHLGNKAMEFSSALRALNLQLQSAATNVADKARQGN